MQQLSIKLKNNITRIMFILTLLVIGFGSLGGGTYNNYNISISFLYFFIFFICFYRQEIGKHINRKLFLAILGMFCLFLISCLFPTFNNYVDIWGRYYALLSCVLFAYCTYILLVKKKVNFLSIIKILAIIGFIHVAVLLGTWFSVPHPERHNWVNGLFFFPNIRHLVDFLTICFLCALGLFFFQSEKSLEKMIWWLISLVILACIFWSGSRAAYIGLLPSVLLLIWHYKKNYLSIVGCILIFLMALYLPSFFDTSSKDLGFSQAIHRSTQGSVEQASTGRFDLYKQVFEWFSYHPFWGNGAEAMTQMDIYIGGLIVFQAHNSILQILVEFGVMGLVGVLYVFYVLLNDFKGKKLNDKQFFSLVTIINIMTAALFNGGAYYVVTISLMCLFIAIMYSEEKAQNG